MPHPDRHTPIGTLLKPSPTHWSGANLDALYVVTGSFEYNPDEGITVRRFLHTPPSYISGYREDMELIHECLLLVEDDHASS